MSYDFTKEPYYLARQCWRKAHRSLNVSTAFSVAAVVAAISAAVLFFNMITSVGILSLGACVVFLVLSVEAQKAADRWRDEAIWQGRKADS